MWIQVYYDKITCYTCSTIIKNKRGSAQKMGFGVWTYIHIQVTTSCIYIYKVATM